MNRLTTATLIAPLLMLGACNVTDNNNGSSTVSLDENRIEQGTDRIADEAAKAGDKAVNAIENAGPAIEKSASDIEERAGRVANRIDNVDVDVDVDTRDKPATNAN
jgi:hypothetical protein